MIFNFFPWQLLKLMSKLFIQYLSPILFPHNPKYDLKYLEFNRLLFDRKITGPYLETLTVCYCLLGAFSYWLKNLMTSKFSCRCHFSMLVYSPSIAEFRWIIFVDQYWWSSMSMLLFLQPAGFLNAVKLFKKCLNLLMKTKPHLVWHTSTYQKSTVNYSKSTLVCFIIK